MALNRAAYCRCSLGSVHWSDGHRQDAGDRRQADEEHAERFHSGVHHVLGQDFRQSDAGSHRRKARQTVSFPLFAAGKLSVIAYLAWR